VGGGVTDCRNRQHDSEYNKRCMPDRIVHLTPNPGISLQSGNSIIRINMRSFLSSPLVVVGKGLKLTRNR
jgi:hypothetical protein